ncbi:hypothetical protein OSTOST_17133 [Ostertagia ostertagi]
MEEQYNRHHGARQKEFNAGDLKPPQAQGRVLKRYGNRLYGCTDRRTNLETSRESATFERWQGLTLSGFNARTCRSSAPAHSPQNQVACQKNQEQTR